MRQAGIVGIPNAGKSTIFNALTAAGAGVGMHPFTTVDPNVGVVPMRDERLGRVAELFQSEKVVPETVRFVDIAGLVQGAHRGEGLGNRFLAHIRETDLLCIVVRCFSDPDVPHIAGSMDPVRDLEIIETELLLADLATVDARLEVMQKAERLGRKSEAAGLDVVESARKILEEGVFLSAHPWTGEEKEVLKHLFALTAKPVIVLANIGEQDLGESGEWETAFNRGYEVVEICAQVEAEAAELPDAQRSEFLRAFRIEKSGLDNFVRAAHKALGLVTFLTAGPQESRAWTLEQGATAAEGAGKIHSDMQRGFIRAETVGWRELLDAGSFAAARDAGVLRLEGKDYVVRDGDVITFRFAV